MAYIFRRYYQVHFMEENIGIFIKISRMFYIPNL